MSIENKTIMGNIPTEAATVGTDTKLKGQIVGSIVEILVDPEGASVDKGKNDAGTAGALCALEGVLPSELDGLNGLDTARRIAFQTAYAAVSAGLELGINPIGMLTAEESHLLMGSEESVSLKEATEQILDEKFGVDLTSDIFA